MSEKRDYMFEIDEMERHINTFPWYVPGRKKIIDKLLSMLSEIEKSIVSLVQSNSLYETACKKYEEVVASLQQSNKLYAESIFQYQMAVKKYEEVIEDMKRPSFLHKEPSIIDDDN